MASEFELRPGESISAYNTRIAESRKARGITDTPAPNANNQPVQDPFIEQLRSSLMEASGMISSQDTEIEKSIADAISGVNKSQEASAGVIRSKADREIGFAREENIREETGFREAQRGFAVNTAAYDKLVTENDKELKDLAQRRDELILQGESAAAATVSDLMMKGLEFRQNSQQRYFQNLLAIGQFGLAAAGEARAERAQNFAERESINNIALEFGLDVRPGETIDSITTRAAPFATENRNLQLSKLRAEIARANAETAKALRGDQFSLDAVTTDALANTIYQMTARGETAQADALLASILEKHGAAGLQKVKAAQYGIVDLEFTDDNLRSSISELYGRGESLGSIIDSFESNPFATAEQKAEAKRIAEELKPKPQPFQFNFGTLGESSLLGSFAR